jgi:tetratricopeptide (TPR) repeat protein
VLVALCCAADPASANDESRRLLAEAANAFSESPLQRLEALVKAREATSADPKDELAWFARGGFALTLSLAKEALESFDKAAAIEPKRADLQFLRGRALQDLGRHQPALGAFRAEPNKEGNPAYYFYRGLASKAVRDYKGALADFDKSDTALEGGRQATQLHRGDIFAMQGKRSAAEQAYRKAISIDPKGPVASTAQARLKALSRPARRGGR